MTIGKPRDIQENQHPYRSRQGVNIQQSQEAVYNFLLEIVKKWPPEEVLLEFKRLFIYHVDSISLEAIQAVYDIVFSNNQEDFRNTLKRSCYILINNWDASRNYKPIRELIQLFCDPSFNRHTASPTLKRLRFWINEFVTSQDFEELKLFTSRYEDQSEGPWSSRYTSYLLVPQYIDLNNPIEQREAARALSKQLKDRFKFDLAMFIARSQTRSTDGNHSPKNPTALGDEALRLIKTIVARRGQFSHANIANIFLSQIEQLTFREFKQSLQKYLTFSVENKNFAETITANLGEKLEDLYSRHDEEIVSPALILRTCNRIIDVLTTDNQTEPSSLFIQLLSQGNPVTLVIVFLKIILICKHSRTHLESRVAELIRYYQEFPEADCEWVVNFLEVFNVTFAIYAENVQYNLIKMQDKEAVKTHETAFDPDTYRIFSQLKHLDKVDLFSGALPIEELDLEDETVD
jgi:hypothetical protein